MDRTPKDAMPHLAFWPPGVPHAVEVPDESLWAAFERRARNESDALALDYMGTQFTWSQLHRQAMHLAGALQSQGVNPGDRVLLFMQNCPHYVLAFHAILRCGAVVVPLNPMSKADELEHYLGDTEAQVAICALDIAPQMASAHATLGSRSFLQHLIGFNYAEALPDAQSEAVGHWPPAWQSWLLAQHPSPHLAGVKVHRWIDVLHERRVPSPVQMRRSDLALLPYTSGTTGLPKGCMHTHASLAHNALANGPWLDIRPGDVILVVVPLFHITGMVVGMLASIRHGACIVILPRWDRRQAALAISRTRVTHWPNIPTMVMDLLGGSDLKQYDLSSLRYIGGGGAAMPEAVAAHLKQHFGLDYVEGYGLTETAAPTHTNPRQAPRRACLGIPFVGTSAAIIHPETLEHLPTGDVGEIVVRGPQLFSGYWKQPEATAAAFIDVAGERYFRTGDLGRVDADGYFYIADRLKRMINASGFKVWPAEVEALLHRHPAVQEACVIAMRDSYRGESVKAVIVQKPDHEAELSADTVIAWAREHMAAYKVPRSVEFVTALPRSASGKVMWRIVQAEHDAAHIAPQPPAVASP